MIKALASILLLAGPVQEPEAKKAWLTKYKDALAQAKLSGRPIFIEAGRAG